MKFLFVYAHMDDETLCSYGTMRKLLDEGHDVQLLTFCGLSVNEKSSRSKFDDRLYVYKESISFLQPQNIFLKNFHDITLTKECVDETLSEIFTLDKPECIVTHSSVDNHFEHRLISQEVLMFSRLNRNSNIKSLWTTTLPSYVQTYSQFGNYQPNIFIDISNYIKQKENALTRYSDCHEIPYDSNDIRSVKACINYNRQLGYQTNRQYCEAYQCLFEVR